MFSSHDAHESNCTTRRRSRAANRLLPSSSHDRHVTWGGGRWHDARMHVGRLPGRGMRGERERVRGRALRARRMHRRHRHVHVPVRPWLRRPALRHRGERVRVAAVPAQRAVHRHGRWVPVRLSGRHHG